MLYGYTAPNPTQLVYESEYLIPNISKYVIVYDISLNLLKEIGTRRRSNIEILIPS